MSRAHASVAALLLLLAACGPEPATETGIAEPVSVDPAEFQAQVDDFVTAWNAGDLETLTSGIAEDAVLLEPDGPPLVGRAAIAADIAENYDYELFQQTGTVDEVLMIGDAAFARGAWRLDPTAAAGADVPPMTGKWAAIYKRGPDGTWQTWRWMWNQPSGQTAEVVTEE